MSELNKQIQPSGLVSQQVEQPQQQINFRVGLSVSLSLSLSCLLPPHFLTYSRSH